MGPNSSNRVELRIWQSEKWRGVFRAKEQRMMKQIWWSIPPRGIRYSMKNGQRNKTMDQHHLTFSPKSETISQKVLLCWFVMSWALSSSNFDSSINLCTETPSLHRTLCVQCQPVPQTHPTRCVLSIVSQLTNYIKNPSLKRWQSLKWPKQNPPLVKPKVLITEFKEAHHMAPWP